MVLGHVRLDRRRNDGIVGQGAPREAGLLFLVAA
jgi:hypothetical protein